MLGLEPGAPLAGALPHQELADPGDPTRRDRRCGAVPWTDLGTLRGVALKFSLAGFPRPGQWASVSSFAGIYNTST